MTALDGCRNAARRNFATSLSLGLAVILAGCSDTGQVVPTTEPTRTEAESPTKSTAFSEVDLTEDLTAANAGEPWVAKIKVATQTEPDRLVVETAIVDPRGENGSPEAQAAIHICKAGVRLLKKSGAGNPYVSIMERDDSTFVVHGHPAYPGGCTEV